MCKAGADFAAEKFTEGKTCASGTQRLCFDTDLETVAKIS